MKEVVALALALALALASRALFRLTIRLGLPSPGFQTQASGQGSFGRGADCLVIRIDQLPIINHFLTSTVALFSISSLLNKHCATVRLSISYMRCSILNSI